MRSSILIRAGGLRAVTAFVSNIMLCLVLISSLLVMWLWPFGGEYHPTVEVRDDAHLFQPAPLIAEIKGMEFRREVHVVVLTVPKVNEASLNEGFWHMSVITVMVHRNGYPNQTLTTGRMEF